MILSFLTQINGKPTLFPEKIITGLFKNNIISRDKAVELFYPQTLTEIIPMEYHGFKGNVEISKIKFDNSIDHRPKIHTIREDKANRWKPGVMIDFFINTRKPDMFRFAPKIQVASIQSIEIKFISIWNSNSLYAQPCVKIDGKIIYDVAKNGKEDMLKLAQNDGFESIDAFFSYFNKDFTGKIIHWTNLKY
ncbi:MAG TPA: hypothetical protein DCQ50_14630 [Chryseobacterium sp.]|nr:hypothetical protein [Chryseobacterium sp.]